MATRNVRDIPSAGGTMIPRILVIAGSDSGGGAGIQADIKTIAMLGGHAMTAITAITAQNTVGVSAIQLLSPEMVLHQISDVVEDIGADAVKIGMIGSSAIAEVVTDYLAWQPPPLPIVLDPVMIASSGAVLSDRSTLESMQRLARFSAVVTPNLPELAVLCGKETIHADRIEEEAGLYARSIGAAVLVKGGHGEGSTIVDRLFGTDGEVVARWEGARIDTRHTHGTGCTLASAIATGLGAGLTLPAAVERAIRFVRSALIAAPGLGQGHGPMGHAMGLVPFEELED